jgi:hypothetical protein
MEDSAKRLPIPSSQAGKKKALGVGLEGYGIIFWLYRGPSNSRAKPTPVSLSTPTPITLLYIIVVII